MSDQSGDDRAYIVGYGRTGSLRISRVRAMGPVFDLLSPDGEPAFWDSDVHDLLDSRLLPWRGAGTNRQLRELPRVRRALQRGLRKARAEGREAQPGEDGMRALKFSGSNRDFRQWLVDIDGAYGPFLLSTLLLK